MTNERERQTFLQGGERFDGGCHAPRMNQEETSSWPLACGMSGSLTLAWALDTWPKAVDQIRKNCCCGFN